MRVLVEIVALEYLELLLVPPLTGCIINNLAVSCF